jgi:hypothetical protein
MRFLPARQPVLACLTAAISGGMASGGRTQGRVWRRNGRTDSIMPDLPAIPVAEPAPRVVVTQVRDELDKTALELNRVPSPMLARPLPHRARAGSDRTGRLASHGAAGCSACTSRLRRHAGPHVLHLAGMDTFAIRVLTLTSVLALFKLHDTCARRRGDEGNA